MNAEGLQEGRSPMPELNSHQYGGPALPNVVMTIAQSGDGRATRARTLARTNPEMGAALSTLPGYDTTVKRLDALPKAVDQWIAATPALEGQAQDLILAALDTGDVDGVPAGVAEKNAAWQALNGAVAAAQTLAGRLSRERDHLIIYGVDALLAHLDERIRETVTALAANKAVVAGIETADDAIDAGLVKDWKAAAELHRAARHIRAAQAALLQIEHRDFLNSLDDRVRVAVTELEQWESVEPRLPQVVRHDGLWKIEKHKHRPENMAERWTVPWPADPDARLAWLALNHPASVRVPSIGDMQAAHKRFTHEAARTTATGERIEPQRMSAEHLGQREQVGAVR